MSEEKYQDKTAEQVKAERFGTNPEDFICVDDIIIASIKQEKGQALFIGTHTRVDIEIAQSRLNYKLFQCYQYMDAEMARNNKPLVQTASKSPIDYARSN